MDARAKRRGGTLAIDHGEKRTGFAVGDELGITARPLETWTGPGASEELLRRLAELLRERDIAVLVLGLPYNMDGSEGARAQSVRAFAARVAERFPELELVLQDERLTTKEAEELMRADHVPPRERKAWRDSYSALVMLREWQRAQRG